MPIYLSCESNSGIWKKEFLGKLKRKTLLSKKNHPYYFSTLPILYIYYIFAYLKILYIYS